MSATMDLDAALPPGAAPREPETETSAALQPYNPERDRETKRGQIAMTLIWLLVALVGAATGFYFGERKG